MCPWALRAIISKQSSIGSLISSVVKSSCLEFAFPAFFGALMESQYGQGPRFQTDYLQSPSHAIQSAAERRCRTRCMQPSLHLKVGQMQSLHYHWAPHVLLEPQYPTRSALFVLLRQRLNSSRWRTKRHRPMTLVCRGDCLRTLCALAPVLLQLYYSSCQRLGLLDVPSM